jgi:hypothetical protein
MNNNDTFVDVATFDEPMEAEALKSALERHWMEARLVVEGGWRERLFPSESARVHVQVPDVCYEEARKYLGVE